MNEILKRDQNSAVVLGGITDDSNQYIRMLRVDPVTNRLLVSGTGGGGGTWYQDEVVATGTTGTSFNLLHTPSNIVFLYKNGQYLISGIGQDYTRSGTALTLAVSLLSTDILTANYS